MKKRPKSNLITKGIETPAYVIEDHILKHNLSIIDYIRKETGCKVLHALKAWSPWNLFKTIKPHVDGTEVSSLYEAQMGYEESGPHVHMYAPAYKPEEFADVMKFSHTIIFNSFSQWAQFRKQVWAYEKRTKRKIECGIRVNPEIVGEQGHGEMWNPCAPGSRLGVRLSEFEQALKEDPKALDGISGFHFHLMFENDMDKLSSSLEIVEERFGKYFALSDTKWVNFGGGLKITDDSFDMPTLVSTIKRVQRQYNVTVHLEPGAAVAWYVGTLVASVLDIVERNDVHFKIPVLDISFEAHLMDFLYNPDIDLEIRGAKIIRDEDEFKKAKHRYKLGGGTCLAGDRLPYGYAFDKPLKVGDKVVFEHAIQYTLVKTTMFNGVKHPSIVLWKDKKAKTLRKFTYQDFKSRMG
ncbi:MAG: carboxynorspermidine decarboxylase [Candidatus Parcubacteria bacterium]|jgi:carboxynorspermidine decarboxylase